jgi:hypothetical protein
VSPLDDLLPQWDVRERHERCVPADPETAVAAALGIPVAPDALVRALFRLRGLSGGGSVRGALLAMGFAILIEEPGCVVFGAAAKPWSPRTRPSAFERPGGGDVLIAASVEAAAVEDGALLATETRVSALDPAARRAFRRYWLVVGPFSGLIRRRWLAAAERALR